MTIYGKIKDYLFRALSLTDPKSWDRSLWNLYGSQSLSGENVTEQTALTYSAVFNAVSLISGTIGTLPLHLMQRKGKTKRITDDHRVYGVMHDQWNPYMTAVAGREVMMAHVLTWGNGYAEKVHNGYGDIVELWPITPNRATPMMQDGKLVYRIHMPDGADIILPRDKVLHIPGLGFDGFTGYSVIAMARKSIGLSMALETFGSNFFGKGTNPSMVVSHPGQLKDSTNLRKALEEVYSGLGQSHRLMLLEEGMKVEKYGIPPDDCQFLECVTPETLLVMSNGTRKAAKDICIGDNIIGWENGKTTISYVSAIGKPTKKNLIKIKTARGRELIASEDHPCLAIERLRTPGSRISKKNPEKWIFIKDLKIGNYVRIALEIPNVESMRLTGSPNWMGFRKGYFLGAMAGDGYIRKDGCTFTNANRGVVTRIAEIIKVFGGDLKSRPCKLNAYNYEIKTNGKRGCKGSYLRTFLNDSGMVGQHSDTKNVPNSVLIGGRDAWKGFLSGYFDTDGSIRKKDGKQTPAMYWSSTSLRMLKECQHLLSMLGIQSSIYSMSSGGTKKIMGKICDYLPSWGLYIMGVSQLKKTAETLSLCHTEKAKRLAEYLEIKPSQYREENFQYDRVVSIEEMGEGETIGIEVFGCHTHVTGGIITHNSRGFQIPEVARWFNLPPHKLKDLSRSSFSNIEQEQISFVVDSILPWLIRLEANYNTQLLTPGDRGLYGQGRLYFKHAVEGLMRGDAASRAEFYSKLFNIGVFSQNDILEKEDMDPFPGGDKHYIQLNLISVEDAEKSPIPSESPKLLPLPKTKEKAVLSLAEYYQKEG